MPAASAPIGEVFEGLVFSLDTISIFAILFLLLTANSIRQERDREGRGVAKAGYGWGLGFLVLIAAVLSGAHASISPGPIWIVPFILAVGFVGGFIYYVLAVRRHLRDDRLQYVVLLWTAYGILVALLQAFLLWLNKNGTQFQIDTVGDNSFFSQYATSFAQISGIIVAATMVVVTNRRSSLRADHNSRQQIYQTLELELLRLFQFECDHPELVARLWFPTLSSFGRAINVPQEVRNYELKQYICQILNLFEMACRFHKQRVFEADVFGSWVIWMWELCKEEVFQNWWPGEEGIEYNYVMAFREIINAGIYFASQAPSSERNSEALASSSDSAADRRRSFFKFVASAMNDLEYLSQWLGQSTMDREKFERFWTIKHRSE